MMAGIVDDLNAFLKNSLFLGVYVFISCVGDLTTRKKPFKTERINHFCNNNFFFFSLPICLIY